MDSVKYIGMDLRQLPLRERKEQLRELTIKGNCPDIINAQKSLIVSLGARFIFNSARLH